MATSENGLSSPQSTSWSDFYTSVKASGFHFVFVVLIWAFFFGVGQIQDMIQQTNGYGVDEFGYSLLYVFASVYFSLVVWLTLRLIFDIKSYEVQQGVCVSLLRYILHKHEASRQHYYAGRWGIQLPRYLSAMPSLGAIVYAVSSAFWWVALLAVLSTSLVLLFLVKRPKDSHALSTQRWFWILLGLFAVSAFGAIFFQSVFITLFNGLNLIWWGLASMLFGFVLTAYFMFDTLNYAIRRFAIQWLKHAFSKPYPVLIPIILIPFVAGILPTSDNHQVRFMAAPKGTLLYPVESLTVAFDNFKNSDASKIQFIDEVNKITYVPVFLVGSQGGGLRASYWTVLALNRLEKLLPGFSNNLFLLSGASGGSVGNAFYFASKQVSSPGTDCILEDLDPSLSADLSGAADTCFLSNAVGKDYLSSVATSFMFNDLLYSFLPAPIPVYKKDRATYLEQSFEKGFAEVYGKVDDGTGEAVSTLGLGYKSFYGNGQWTPLLLGTSTIQETGLMSVYAPFPIKGEVFNNKLDTNLFINSAKPKEWVTSNTEPPVLDMRLSTVAVNSARFPYVTPTGTLNVEAPRAEKFHTADAGYFDNYGAATLLDVMEELLPPVDINTQEWQTVYVPIPVILKNDILIDKYRQHNSRSVFDISEPNISAGTRSIFGHELLSPIQALIEIRGGLANTKLAELIAYQKRHPNVQAMLGLLQSDSVLVSMLPENSPLIAVYYQKLKDEPGTTTIEPPLGWWLSKESKEDMLCQILLFPKQEYRGDSPICKAIEKRL